MRTTPAALLLAPAIACSAIDDSNTSAPLCPADEPPAGCWEQLRPLGSGGFAPDPGSSNTPKWAPGKFPLALVPLIGPDGDLWMISQTHAYSSPDGLTWTQHDKADWGERIGQAYASFAGRLWLLGGLDYASKTPLRDLWSSPDGVQWQRTGDAAWPARKGHTVVAFKDRLWLFGGVAEVDAEFATVRAYNDVWSSLDGEQWSQVTAAAPWSAREHPGVVVHADALYLLGGEGIADVWRSPDGESWTQLTATAPWGPGRHAYAHHAFADKLWLFGGFIDRSTNATNDVWSSADGLTWTQQTADAPWAPRTPRTVVFHDLLWIFSGKHTGAADNWGGDLWVMHPSPAP